MARIDVTMPIDGSIHVTPTYRIRCNKKIHWDFFVKNTAVKWVLVEFEEQDSALYFRDKPKRKHRKSDKVVEGKAHVRGISPGHYENPSFEIDKYDIRGYDGDPDADGTKPVIRLDPVIIVETP